MDGAILQSVIWTTPDSTIVSVPGAPEQGFTSRLEPFGVGGAVVGTQRQDRPADLLAGLPERPRQLVGQV
jgi:hypothetical protein